MPIRFFFAIPALLLGTGLFSSGLTQDLRGHLRAGSKITPEKAASLEAELAENPEDLLARVQLVGYYFGDYIRECRKNPNFLA